MNPLDDKFKIENLDTENLDYMCYELADRYYRAMTRDDKMLTNGDIVDLRALRAKMTHLYVFSDSQFSHYHSEILDQEFLMIGRLESWQYFYCSRENNGNEQGKTYFIFADTLPKLRDVVFALEDIRTSGNDIIPLLDFEKVLNPEYEFDSNNPREQIATLRQKYGLSQ